MIEGSAARRVVGGSAAVVAFLLLWTADSHAACESAINEWVSKSPEACHFKAVVCPPGGAVVEAPVAGGPPLRVELRKASPGAFRTVRGVSLSPVLEAPDWNKVPAPIREAFDGVVRCIEKHSEPLPIGGEPAASPAASAPTSFATEPPTQSPPRSNGSAPWRLFIGLALALGVGATTCRRSFRTEAALAAIALPLGTALLWRVLFPSGYLHPNGQGPAWIAYALDGDVGRSPYGPGFAEVFGAVARGARDPDGAVMLANVMLCSTLPFLAWWIARRVFVQRSASWGLALAVALLPALGRVAQSQSYYGPCIALFAWAAAILATGPRHLRDARTWATCVVGAVGAGLIVAQAMRVHPICWIAAAVTPLAALAVPGRLRTRATRVIVAGLVVGATAAISTLPALRAVADEAVGRQWGDRGLALVAQQYAVPAGLAVAALIAAATMRSRLIAAVLALGAIVTPFLGSRLIDGDPAIYQRAYELFALGPFVAVAATLLASRRRERFVGALVLTLAVAFDCISSWRDARTLSTPSLEQEAIRSLRESLPQEATVLFFSRAGQRVLLLPLYRDQTLRGPRPFPLRAGDAVPTLAPRDGYYYRSSLCSTADGREACAAAESRWTLTAIAERTFDARPSKTEHPYESERVSVGLFRIDGTK